jgi:3-oxoacyl-[acyl-carrier protein] reductase
VAISARDGRRLEEAAGSIRAAAAARGRPGAQVLAVPADLATSTGPESFIAAAAAGLGPCDILVANCGGPKPGRGLALRDQDWKEAFDLTFLSSSRLVAAAAPGMRDRGWGRIIFITSITVRQPVGDLVLSTALRSAVTGYAKTLADDLAPHGVTVNCVAPGSIATARLESLLLGQAESRGVDPARLRAEREAAIPARRFGQPEEFAAVVAFLASARASYVTGVTLAVDGGAVRSLV